MAQDRPRHLLVEKVETVLGAHGLYGRIRELPTSARTADDAARALGCDLRCIVKSLVFRTTNTSHAILILTAGDHRVDERWMERCVGEPIVRADPEFARTATGYPVGGVPPVGHPRTVRTYIDYDLLELPEVWGAAGTPTALCRLSGLELLRASRGRAVPVVPLARAEDAGPRWVTFDCYGTLVDWRAGLLGALDRALPAMASVAPGAKERLFRAFLAEERRQEAGPYRSYREVMADALGTTASAEGLPLDRASAESIVDSIPDWPLFPDTEIALRELAGRGVRLAVLSNIDRDLLERTFSRHGLRFATRVSAEDVGAYKPAPAHWIRFLKETGADPERVWHVAGSYEYDILTACALGFRTAFVTRYDESGEGDCADVVVADLAEFAQRLALPPQRNAIPGAPAGPGPDRRP